MARVRQWCVDATEASRAEGGPEYGFVYVDQQGFERHRPDVVVSVDRFGLRFLEARTAKIPEEVSYASLDLDGIAADHPEMSGIDQNSHLVGAAAVDMLVAAIQRGQRGIPGHPVRTEIEGTWVAGKSTFRQRRAAE